MTDKKKEELKFLKESLNIVGFKKCSITPLKSTQLRGTANRKETSTHDPDFKLAIENKIIGVEVTEYYVDAKHSKGGSRSRANETYDDIRKIVNEKAKENSNLKDIYGSLSLKNQKGRPQKAELEKFADDLIRLVAEFIRKNKNFKEKSLVPEDGYSLLKKFLKSVMLQRVSSSILWDITYGGSTGLEEKNLINTIKPKLEKRQKYNYNNFNELWLLVVFGSLFSQVVPRPWAIEDKLRNFDKINRMLKTSYFDKVYLYLRNDKTVFKWPGWIKIEPKSS